jgi:hypothetical protein
MREAVTTDKKMTHAAARLDPDIVRKLTMVQVVRLSYPGAPATPSAG